MFQKKTILNCCTIVLMFAISHGVEARYHFPGGWGGTSGSIFLHGFILGGGRTDALIISELFPGEVQYECVNKAGNAESEGSVYDLVAVSGSTVISEDNIDDSGRVSASIFYNDEVLAAGLDCHNAKNWSVVEETVAIWDFDAELTMYECPLSGCAGFDPGHPTDSYIDRIRLTCHLPASTTFPIPLGTAYICNQVSF